VTTPTISSVLPGKGHTGGQQLVEIIGTGFAPSPAPPDVLPLPAPRPYVSVRFDGVEATNVEVLDDGLTLYCFTPIHDPGVVDVVVQNLGETPAAISSGAGPFAISSGDAIDFEVNGEPQTIAFGPGDIAAPGAATALELAAALNRLRGASAVASAGRATIKTDARGPTASLEVTGASAAAALGFPSTIVSGTEDLIPIDGELATAVSVYEFARPDLTRKLPPTLAIEQLLVELGRQVIANVNIASHSDFDPDSGDLTNTAIVATLPAMVLADVQLPETSMPIARVDQEKDGADGVTVITEPEDLVDILVSIVVVTDSPIELVNLAAITRRFFRKNAGLVVPVDPNDATKGTATYPMQWEMGTPINITAQRGGENLQTFTGQAMILGVPSGEMPIEYAGAMPTGVPQGADYETVRELGWPRTAPTDVGVGPSSSS
jgi:hypothetical protein